MSQGSGESRAEEPPGGGTHSRVRKRLWAVAKWSLTLLVLAFVAVRAAKLWREGSAGDVDLHFGWLVFAGVLYAAGWVPSAWYWKVLLARMGDEISWPAAFRAYYCGHLGKYVPGKALVPVIRGQMAAAAGGRFRAGALAAVYDTLVMMGVGAEVTVALFPYLLPEDPERSTGVLRAVATHPWGRWLLDHPLVLPLAVLAFVVASLPVVGRLFAFVAGKFAPVENAETLARRIDARTIGEGFVVFCAAWAVHGLALWATLRGVGAEAS
ncbi:MAG TPA: lysylphosphatidylglycerol synthase domain-containing protein, partial [Planctomycetaceae bacterium]